MRKIKLEEILKLKEFLKKWCEDNVISTISYSTVYGEYLNGNLRISSGNRYIYQDGLKPFPPSIDIDSVDLGDNKQ